MYTQLHPKRQPYQDRIPRNPREAAARATASCTAWNHTYPVGTKVHVYRLLGVEETAIDSTTTSQAWVMGGHSAMVMIHGLSGGYALTHVKPLIGSSECDLEEREADFGCMIKLDPHTAAGIASRLESGVAV
jgi:hypothetical protein